MLRIGLVNFLNAYPLYYALEKHPQRRKTFELFYEVPSQLSQQMQDNKIDVSLVSSVEYFRHRALWNYFPHLGIASRGKVESIRFFMHPAHPFLQGKDIAPLQKVFLDYASKSSVAMCKMILQRYPQVSPDFITVKPPHTQRLTELSADEALLLIGDEALAHKKYPSLDMGEWYYKIFQKPFVYALWVYHENLQENEKEQLADLFLQAYRKGQQEKDVMINEAAQKFSFTHEYCRHYFEDVIHYELDSDLLAGMDFFFSQTQ